MHFELIDPDTGNPVPIEDGAEGELVADEDGVAVLEQRWNAFGELELERFLGPDREPVRSDGCAEIERSFDGKGELVSERCDGEERAPDPDDEP